MQSLNVMNVLAESLFLSRLCLFDTLVSLHILSWQAFNVLRYERGQKYDSHMDVFDPKEYGPQESNRVGYCTFSG